MMKYMEEPQAYAKLTQIACLSCMDWNACTQGHRSPDSALQIRAMLTHSKLKSTCVPGRAHIFGTLIACTLLSERNKLADVIDY